MKKELEKNLKKKIYRATKFSHQPKARLGAGELGLSHISPKCNEIESSSCKLITELITYSIICELAMKLSSRYGLGDAQNNEGVVHISLG